jgi:hypothetical protein
MFSKIFQVLKRTKIEKKTNKILFLTRKGDSRSEAGMTRKASAARMSILILIAEPQLSSPVRGMTRSRAMQKHACTFLYPRRTSQATKWNDKSKKVRTKADITNTKERSATTS